MTAPPWQHGPAAPYPHVTNENAAADNAQVGQQIGVNYGDSTVHNSQIYNINQGDPPERRYMVAMNHLKGGTPRFAEEILAQLVREGHASTELAYYYTLSVLSGRSLNEIDGAVFGSFTEAHVMAKNFPVDEWSVSLAMVGELMSTVWRQEVESTPDIAEMQQVLDKFTSLPSLRRAEIIRHLDMILSGAIQDLLDAVDARRVATQRMKDDRRGRAWKFFEPDPARPRMFERFATPIEPLTWLKACGGGALFLVGLGLAVAATGQGVLALLGALAAVGGGYLAVDRGAERLLAELTLRRLDAEHGLPFVEADPNSPGHWVSTAFVREMHRRVDAGFRAVRPHTAGNWMQDTRGIREYYKARFVALYGNANVIPSAVDWLVRWHARRIGTSWRNGTLYDYRDRLLQQARNPFPFGLGLAVGALGVVAALGGGAFLAAVMLGGGGYIVVFAAVEIVAKRRHDRARHDDDEQLCGEEMHAYGEWVTVLADRPTDAEMAEWLDLDTSFLKTAALRRCGLTNRDIVAHVALTEGTAKARRARVLHGPVRCSEYVVLVFLLTRSGVREVEVDLDFLNGDIHDERRMSFRYDSLASARVDEVGVRFANDRRYIMAPDDPNLHQGGDQIVLRRAFRLNLLDGQSISVVVENFDGISNAAEDLARLRRMALDSSGIAGALHVLEAVAAEGRDWIAEEQGRRERRSEEWGKNRNPYQILPNLRPDDPDDGAPGLPTKVPT